MKLKEIRALCQLSIRDTAELFHSSYGYVHARDARDANELKYDELNKLSQVCQLSTDALVKYNSIPELLKGLSSHD